MRRKRNIVDRTRRTQRRIHRIQEDGGFDAVKEFMRRWPQCWRIFDAINQSAYAFARGGISHQTKAEWAADQLYERIRELIRTDPEEYTEGRGPRWGKIARKLGARSANQLRLIWRRRTADRNS